MLKLFFFLTLVILCDTSIRTIQIFKQGTYTLTSADYEFSENFIIEIWGAGSGCSIVCDNDCNSIKNYYYFTGNSGVYIKANIITKQDTFYLTIGKGGNSCTLPSENYNYFICSTYTATDSVLKSNNIELIASAGSGVPCTNSYVTNSIDSKYGYILYTALSNCGIASSAQSINVINTPSDNGYYINNTIGYGASCGTQVNGSDGGAIIYYNSILSATVTPTPTVTTTSSNTYSITPSITPSITISSTISVSQSDSPSISVSVSITSSISLTTSLTCTVTPIASSSASNNPTNSTDAPKTSNALLGLSSVVYWSLCTFGPLVLCCVICVSKCLDCIAPKKKTKKINSIDDLVSFTINNEECIICLANQEELYKCNYDHYICKECLIRTNNTKNNKNKCALGHELLEKMDI